jgi:hypothetical protein
MKFARNSSSIATFLTGLCLSSFGLWIYLSSYFDIRILESISFFAQDGHCDPSNQGLGAHCFGDYYHPLNAAKQTFPWDGYIPYPAAPLSLFKPFAIIENLTNSSRFALAVYMTILTISVAVPSIWVSKKADLTLGTTIFVLSGPFSFAGMIVLDRGNLVGLLSPILLLFLIGLKNTNINQIHLAIIASAAIKPQFAMLAIVFLLINQGRSFLLSVRLLVLSQLLPFLFWPRNFPSNIFTSLRMLLDFNSYGDSETLWPSEISLNKAIQTTGSLFDNILKTNLHSLSSLSYIQSNIGAAIMISLLIVSYLYRDRFPKEILGIYCTLIFTVAPNTVYNYYLIVAGPILGFCIVILYENQQENSNKVDLRPFKAIVLFVGISLIAIPLPGVSDNHPFIISSLAFTPFIWVFLVFDGLKKGICKPIKDSERRDTQIRSTTVPTV